MSYHEAENRDFPKKLDLKRIINVLEKNRKMVESWPNTPANQFLALEFEYYTQVARGIQNGLFNEWHSNYKSQLKRFLSNNPKFRALVRW